MPSERWMTRVKGGLVSSHLNADARSNPCLARAVCIFDGAHERASVGRDSA
jgi:hypothetical protein